MIYKLTDLNKTQSLIIDDLCFTNKVTLLKKSKLVLQKTIRIETKTAYFIKIF